MKTNDDFAVDVRGLSRPERDFVWRLLNGLPGALHPEFDYEVFYNEGGGRATHSSYSYWQRDQSHRYPMQVVGFVDPLPPQTVVVDGHTYRLVR